MSVQRYGTYLLLLRLYNESPLYSTEKILAKYFLKNFTCIKDVNIYDVATECNVSRATVRRFFGRLGYDSFLDFKSEFKVPYDIGMFGKELERKNYTEEHIKQLNEIPFFFLNNKLDILGRIKALAKVMHKAGNIYWVTSSSTTRFVEDMQMQFMQFDCFWDVIVSYNRNMGIRFTKEDIVIVFSVSGVMAEHLIPELKGIQCSVYLVTINKTFDNEIFDEVIRLCNDELYYGTKQISDEAIKEEVVYRRYATNLFFDFLYYEYARCYENKRL
ncbi:MurR/RpiR family transcriptional regulator [Lacrimispora sp.]|uniref:MurR/RpiR family transcriptional regulator n=1 Tax=Lacrimispora sp. TaxID=2719234 RepID=UPI00289FEC98|nr:hypothetical protein [Lacrimispora sp.]